MKKYYIILMAAVLVGLAACAKQEAKFDTPADTPEIVAEDLVVFTATDGEAKTKSEIDGSTGKFTWNTTDRIAVHTTAGYKLSATADVDGEDAGLATFTVDKGGAAINGFALSPYTLVYDDLSTVNTESAAKWGNGGGDLVVNLPGTYTLADIAGDKSPIPAIAVNEDGDLHFKQLGALLRVTLNNLPPSTRSVTIDFNGKKVQGAFTISSPDPGNSQIETSAIGDADVHDIITINTPDISAWTDGQVVNIPVPIGTYTTITVTSWNAADGGGTATVTMTRYIKVVSGVASNWTPSRRGARKVIASMPVFTLDAGVRVQIAPANMYYDSSTSKWKMFDHAYDCTFGQVTTHLAQGHLVPTYHTTGMDPEDPDYEAAAALDEAELEARLLAIRSTANRDLFQWEEIKEVTFSGNDFAGHNDWRWGASFVRINNVYRGTTLFARIILDAKNGFPDLTLSRGNELYKPARTMGGTSGVFYFPDKWDDSLNTTTIQLKKNNSEYKYADGTEPDYTDYAALTDLLAPEITMEVFNQLLDAGAVFIPSSGLIYSNGYFSSAGVVGGTWTSTQNAKYEDRQNAFYHSVAGITRNGGVGKTQFRSIRLVRDIN